MSETPPRWYEIAEKNLEEGDEIQKSYPGKLDGESGYLLLSNKKLQFVHEEGFLRKSYEINLELSYDEIRKISPNGRYELDLTDKKGKKHDFKTFEIPESIIEKNLEELLESSIE